MSLALLDSLSVTKLLKAACGGGVGEPVEMGVWWPEPVPREPERYCVLKKSNPQTVLG